MRRRKNPTLDDLERRFGKSWPEIAAEAYNAHRSIRAAASSLGMDPSTYYGWLRRLGFRISLHRSLELREVA